MKHKTNRSILVLTLLIALTSTSFAQRPDRRGQNEDRPAKLWQELKLTEEQEAKMKDLRLAQQEKMIDLRADKQKAELGLRKLMSADEPNKKKIYAQVDKVAATEVKIEKSRIDHRLEVRGLLTDEQLKVYQKAMHSKPKRGCDGNGKGNRGPGRDFPHRRF